MRTHKLYKGRGCGETKGRWASNESLRDMFYFILVKFDIKFFNDETVI